jgi:hypothetical protein
MKLSAILEPMIAAGVPGSVILDTVRAYEEQAGAALEEGKEKARERWRRWKNKQGTNVGKRLQTDTNVSKQLAGAEDNNLTTQISRKDKVIASPSAPPKRASRLHADWTLPDEWLNEAVSAGLPRQRAISEAERMKNWSLSNRNGAKLDWLAAWRNWYRDKIEPQRSLPAKPPDRPPRNAGEAARLELLRRENLDAPNSQIRHDDESDGGPGFAGTGIARRIALASSR